MPDVSRAEFPSSGRSARDFDRLCRNAVVFGRGLRANGFRSQPDRTMLFAEALDAVGLRSRADARAAARAVFARSADDARSFDAAFDAVWASSGGWPGREEHDEGERDDGGTPRERTQADAPDGARAVRSIAAAPAEAHDDRDRLDADQKDRETLPGSDA